MYNVMFSSGQPKKTPHPPAGCKVGRLSRPAAEAMAEGATTRNCSHGTPQRVQPSSTKLGQKGRWTSGAKWGG